MMGRIQSLKCFEGFSIIISIKDAQDIELYQARLFFDINICYCWYNYNIFWFII